MIRAARAMTGSLILFVGSSSLRAEQGEWAPSVEMTDKTRWQAGESKGRGVLGGIEQQGRSPSGWFYGYQEDGTGYLTKSKNVVSTWVIACVTDAMTDQRLCAILGPAFGLNLRMDEPGKIDNICAADHDHPRYDAMIRLDGEHPISSKGGCFGEEVAKKALAARSVTVRSYKFPYENARDYKSDLANVGEAISLASFLYQRFKSKP